MARFLKEIKIKILRLIGFVFPKEDFWVWVVLFVYLVFFGVANFSLLDRSWLIFDLFLIFSGFGLLISGFLLLRWKAEQIKNDKDYTQGIVQDLGDGVVAYDKDFLVKVFNPAAERIFNLKRKEIIGKYISPALSANPKYRLLVQIVFPSLAPVVKNKKINGYQEEYDVVFDDPYREFHILFNRIVNEKGEIIGFVKVIHDSTREKELLKEKSEFLDIAAHNFNTPITELRWGLESLLEEARKDKNLSKYKEVLSHLEQVTKGLADLVADLLAVTRIEKGRFGYSFEEIDLINLIEGELEKWAPIIKKHSLKLYFEKPKETLPKVFVDPLRIKLVLDNLIENAMVYNVVNGEIRVKVEKMEKKPFVIVSVKDTGIGIPDDEKRKIFEKLFRGKKAVKYQTTGIGLGLYISRNIIRRHGGEMWFDSIEGRGSTFYFSLPLKKELIPPMEIPLS